MANCPLLVRTPTLGYRCQAGHAVAYLTLYAFCSGHHTACPDYGRHMGLEYNLDVMEQERVQREQAKQEAAK